MKNHYQLRFNYSGNLSRGNILIRTNGYEPSLIRTKRRKRNVGDVVMFVIDMRQLRSLRLRGCN